MGAARKLQQEIDLVMKKVKEGVGAFDEIHDKISEQAQTPHQREKLVQSLKDQIKKLQKDRDKIKSWVSDKDVRDKKQLTDARATIERRMEKFKECEKDMKVKDFSKVGLEKGVKLDPKQVETDKRREWLRKTVETINGKVEVNEAEIESLMANLKRNKEPPARVAELQALNVRHKQHTERLEQVHRALDNEVVTLEQVDALKDAIEDYMDSVDDDVDGMYDDVDAQYDEDLLSVIDSMDVHVPLAVDRAPVRTDATDKAEKKGGRTEREAEKLRAEAAREKEREKANVAAMRAQIGKGAANFPSTTVEEAKPVVRATIIKDPPPPPPPPRSTATANASPSPISHTTGQSIHASHQSDSSAASAPVPKGLAGTVWAGGQPPPPPEKSPDASPLQALSAVSREPSLHAATTASGHQGSRPLSLASAASEATQSQETLQPPPPPPPAPAPGPCPTDLLPPIPIIEPKQPHPFDSVWNRNVPARKTRATHTPASYPKVAPVFLENLSWYHNIKEGSEEDLLAAFYLTPGTWYQYQAAIELKKRNWRFHKQHAQWFRRHDGKHETTAEYEQGDYIYFDYQLDRADAWVFRLKSNYKFPFDQLENEIGVS